MSLKKTVLARIIVSLIFGLLFGALLLIIANNVPVTDIIKWALIITGVIVIISNIPSLVAGIVNIKEKSGVVDLVLSALGMIFGLLMILKQNEIITIIVGAYLIVFPIIRIIISNDKKAQLKDEWLKILIGAILIAFLPAIMGAANTIGKLIVTILAYVVMGVSLISFVISLVSYIRVTKKATEDPDVIETTAEEE